MRGPDFHPAGWAIVEAPSELLLELQPGPAAPTVQVVSCETSAVRLETESPAASFLVAADTYYPGWEASIDANPARLFIADVAFRGLQVPAGHHRIEMRFVPRILYRSASVSALAPLAAAMAILRFRIGRRADDLRGTQPRSI